MSVVQAHCPTPVCKAMCIIIGFLYSSVCALCVCGWVHACMYPGKSTLVKEVCLEDGDGGVLPGVELMFQSFCLSSHMLKLFPTHTLPTCMGIH